MFYPDFQTAQKLAQNYSIIPVSMEFFADMDTPISVFKKIETDRYCFLLESVEGSRFMTRYSIIGRNPFLCFSSKNDKITLTYPDGRKNTYTGDPMAELQSIYEQFSSPDLEGLPSFSGGAAGCFAYDTIRLFENLPSPPPDPLGFPDMNFMFADEIIVFDHHRQRIVIIVNMHRDSDISVQYERAAERIIQIRNEIESSSVKKSCKSIDFRQQSKPQSNMTKEEFCKNVEKAKEYIKNGDIFQVVLSQRFCIDTDIDPFDAYRAIRTINPSPYMFYLKFDDFQLAGASPEMLVRVENGDIRTCPIAGTRPRGKDPSDDERLMRELLADPKENAEHMMLVDLGRNDVGKLSEFGSVSVERLKYIQKFSHVMHMTSDVKGRIRNDKSIFDAIASLLPAGTLSGAPKIRAMEIIDELEKCRRGFYGGAVAYLSFSGRLDSCITIRSALFKDKKAYIQAGGGIVYDSVPENEYLESVNKAASMIRAVCRAADIR